MPEDQWMHRPCPGHDIISEIPDMILFYILTFLPRKDAVRTGILSSKWKNLWKNRFPYKTILTFGRPTHNEIDQNELATEIQEQMSNHGERKIEVFNLYFYPGNKHEKITALWVEQAVLNGVEEFNLDFSQDSMGLYPKKQIERRAKKFQLHESLFQKSKFLIILSLNYCRLHRYFRFRYFSCLESLSLCRVNINNEMLGKLLSNCLQLKFLELKQCNCLKHIKVPAKLLGLKKLIIAYCSNTKEINIAAPMLHSFYFFGRFPNSFVLFEDTPFLGDAIIACPVRENCRQIGETLLFIWLDHAQVLTLCTSSLMSMFEGTKTTNLSFDRLRELQLLMKEMSATDLNNMYRFFKHCNLPHLERLFIELPTFWIDYSKYSIHQLGLQYPPQLTFEHLKLIKINNFRGYLNEKHLLDFFLNRCLKLELVILVFPLEFHKFTSATETECLFNYLTMKNAGTPNTQIVWFNASQDDNSFRAAHSKDILLQFSNK